MTNTPRARRMIGDFDDNIQAPLTDVKTTYFLPAGTENLAELDRWGRAKRAYLFAGAERIGYKAKTGTGLYIKDHLGTSKVVMVQPKSAMADSSLISVLQDPPEPGDPVEDRTSYEAVMEFNFDRDSEGWTVHSQLTDPTFWEGEMCLQSTGDDPKLISPPLDATTDEINMLFVTMRVTAESGNANLFWRSDSETYSSSRFTGIALRRQGEKYTYGFRIGNGPGEAIHELRLDPASASGAEIAIDRIEAVYVNNVDYHFASHSEGWNPYRDEATRQIDIPVVKDGILTTRSTGSDPILQMTTPLKLVGDDIDQITVRMRVDGGNRCQLYWKPVGGTYANKLTLFLTNDGEFHDYVFDVGSNANWAGNTIERLRFDPTNAANVNIEIDYITSNTAAVCKSVDRTVQPTYSFDNLVLVKASDNDPYGVQLRDLHPDYGQRDPHGYTGQEREDDLGLYHYGARMYMPEIGRFLQPDPAREFVNPYSYVGNYPVGAVDPTGMRFDPGNATDEQVELLLGELMFWTGWMLDLDPNTQNMRIWNESNPVGGAPIFRDIVGSVIQHPDKFVLCDASGTKIEFASIEPSADSNGNIVTYVDFDDFSKISCVGAPNKDCQAMMRSFGVGALLLHEWFHGLTGLDDQNPNGTYTNGLGFVTK